MRCGSTKDGWVMVERSDRMRSTGCNLKNDRMISVHFQCKPFNIAVTQVHDLTSNTEEAEVERFYEDLTRLCRTKTQKRCPFHYRGLECKSRKSRNTWRTGFGLGVENEGGQRLIEFYQENVLVIANTLFQQHMNITRRLTPKSG